MEQADQVPRKLQYERLHPDAKFYPPCQHDPMRHVQLGDGTVEVRALHLGDLMDTLEKMTGEL